MKITVSEAAKLLGGSPAWTRHLCEKGLIGDKWHSVFEFKYHMNPPKRFTYVIVPGKLAKYMEISEEELERRLEGVRNG